MTRTACLSAVGLIVALGFVAAPRAQGTPPAGFASIFNGKDLTGWKIPEKDGGHWKVVDGVIDYDAGSLAEDKNLWTVKVVPELRTHGRLAHQRGRLRQPEHEDRHAGRLEQEERRRARDQHGGARFGLGHRAARVREGPVQHLELACGSGEMYGYRTDAASTPEMRRNATPRLNADKNIGDWNTFHITVVGTSVTCVLNGQTVIPRWTLADLPAAGPIGLQHHGGPKGPDGTYPGIPALLQFRNIYVKELP